MQAAVLKLLKNTFGDRLIANVPLSANTTMNVGGPADWAITINHLEDLEKCLHTFWEGQESVVVLGGGSNILVSDIGYRGTVIFNHASAIKVDENTNPPTIWTESGASLFQLSRVASEKGLSGLEWCSLIPGTVGGAVFGNAGAHGGEVCKNLLLAEILHRTKGKLSLSNEEMGFSYRSTRLKKEPGEQVILSSSFKLTRSTPQAVQARVTELVERRRITQPAGVGFGSTFRNPPDDKAGRLIEAVGLKGVHQGGAMISTKHANFILNEGNATAMDVWTLLRLAYRSVLEKFNISLIPEIELIGEWDSAILQVFDQMRAAAVES